MSDDEHKCNHAGYAKHKDLSILCEEGEVYVDVIIIFCDVCGKVQSVEDD